MELGERKDGHVGYQLLSKIGVRNSKQEQRCPRDRLSASFCQLLKLSRKGKLYNGGKALHYIRETL